MDVIKNIFNEGKDVTFRDETEFLGFLGEVEESTNRTEHPINKMKILCGGNENMLVFPGAFEGYTLKTEGKEYAIRDSAMTSLCQRAGISGPALERLNPAELCKILNTCFNVAKKDSSALVVDIGGAVSAVLSDNYRVINVAEIFETVKEKMQQQKAVFSSGSVDATTFRAEYILPDKIKEPYEALSTEFVNFEKMVPIAEFVSSNTGHSGANIYPKFRNRNTEFIVGKPLYTEHKGESTAETFAKNVDLIFALFNKSTKALEKLRETPIVHKEGCFRNIAKKVMLPKKATLLALEDFLDVTAHRNVVTALDIYMGLTDIISYAKDMGKNYTYIQENLARALFLDWNEYDTLEIK